MKTHILLLLSLITLNYTSLILIEKGKISKSLSEKKNKERKLFLLSSNQAKEKRFVLRNRCNLKR